MHRYRQAHMYRHICTQRLTHMHAKTYMYICTQRHTRTQGHSQTQIHAHRHAHTDMHSPFINAAAGTASNPGKRDTAVLLK